MSTYNLKISQLERERDKWHTMYKHSLASWWEEYNSNIRLTNTVKELSAQLQRLQQRQKAQLQPQPKKKQKPVR